MGKLPAIMFYPADWRKDLGVQSLDYFDRGVWFEIICFMHESEKRGKLSINDKPVTPEMLAKLLGLTFEKTDKTVKNLLDFGVMSLDSEGFYICRRMMKDEQLREVRSESGKQGGRPKANQKQTKSKTKKLASSAAKAKSKQNTVNEDESVNVNEDNKLIEIADKVYIKHKELKKIKGVFCAKCEVFQVKPTLSLYEKFLEDFQNRKSQSSYKGRYQTDLPLMANWGFRAFFELYVKEQTLAASLLKSKSNTMGPVGPSNRPEHKVFRSDEDKKILGQIENITKEIGK